MNFVLRGVWVQAPDLELHIGTEIGRHFSVRTAKEQVKQQASEWKELDLRTFPVRNLSCKTIIGINLVCSQVSPPKWAKPLSRACVAEANTLVPWAADLWGTSVTNSATNRTAESLVFRQQIRVWKTKQPYLETLHRVWPLVVINRAHHRQTSLVRGPPHWNSSSHGDYGKEVPNKMRRRK